MTETEAVCSLAPFLNKDREENPKVVLAGDNRQLTYTPRSQAANLGGMTTDLMTRLMKLEAYRDDRYITHLVDNFRNDKLLISVLNQMIYENRIQCKTTTTSGKIVAKHTVSLTQRPVNDTSAVDAITCLELAQKEKLEHPDKKTIILCLYKAQMALLTRLQTHVPETERIEIVTAESVQGSQAETVILSPSVTGIYPFNITKSTWPTNLKRLTMSISRAKNTFILVGNLLLLNRISAFSYLIEVADITNHLLCDEHVRQIIRRDR